MHVVKLMQAAEEGTFVEFGGHAASAGFAVAADAVHLLETRLTRALEVLAHEDETEEERADLHLTPETVTHAVLALFDRLAPFGMGNPRPLVALHDVSITEVAWFGKQGEHLRIRIAREREGSMEAIAFYARRELGKDVDRLAEGKRAHLLVHVERDQFTRGQPVRLRLVSVR